MDRAESARAQVRDQVRDILEGRLYTTLWAIVNNLDITLNKIKIHWKVLGREVTRYIYVLEGSSCSVNIGPLWYKSKNKGREPFGWPIDIVHEKEKSCWNNEDNRKW